MTRIFTDAPHNDNGDADFVGFVDDIAARFFPSEKRSFYRRAASQIQHCFDRMVPGVVLNVPDADDEESVAVMAASFQLLLHPDPKTLILNPTRDDAFSTHMMMHRLVGSPYFARRYGYLEDAFPSDDLEHIEQTFGWWFGPWESTTIKNIRHPEIDEIEGTTRSIFYNFVIARDTDTVNSWSAISVHSPDPEYFGEQVAAFMDSAGPVLILGGKYFPPHWPEFYRREGWLHADLCY